MNESNPIYHTRIFFLLRFIATVLRFSSFSIRNAIKMNVIWRKYFKIKMNHLPATVNVLCKRCTFIIGEFIVTVAARWWWRCKRTMSCSGHRLSLVKLSSSAFRCVYLSEKKKTCKIFFQTYLENWPHRECSHRTFRGEKKTRFVLISCFVLIAYYLCI